MNFRFQVGDQVRVIGVETSHSIDIFLDRVGTVMYFNNTCYGDSFAQFAYAVAFDDLPRTAGHYCDLMIRGDRVFRLDSECGNWFKDCDLELYGRAVALDIDPDIL